MAEIVTLPMADTQHRKLEALVRRQGTERKGLLLVSCRRILLF